MLKIHCKVLYIKSHHFQILRKFHEIIHINLQNYLNVLPLI